MVIKYLHVRYLDHKSRATIQTYDTRIQAVDAWQKSGRRPNERVIIQWVDDDYVILEESASETIDDTVSV